MIKQVSKVRCRVHNYYYTGSECPFCRQERSQLMASKWVFEDRDLPKEKEGSSETMDEMLNKLKEKYNKQ